MATTTAHQVRRRKQQKDGTTGLARTGHHGQGEPRDIPHLDSKSDAGVHPLHVYLNLIQEMGFRIPECMDTLELVADETYEFIVSLDGIRQSGKVHTLSDPVSTGGTAKWILDAVTLEQAEVTSAGDEVGASHYMALSDKV